MKNRGISRRRWLRASIAYTGLIVVGCSQTAPPPAPTAAPAARPTSAPAPTGAAQPIAAPAKPTAAPTTAPTAVAKHLKVRLAWVAKTTGQMQWLVAQEGGYFAKYGLDSDLQYINGSTAAVPALLAGDVDQVAMAGSATVSAQAAGSDIIMVAGFQNESIFRIVAVPSIAKIEDMKGKTVAVTGVGSNDYFIWQTIIRRQGWTQDDVKLIAATNVDGQVAMLQRGDVQAIAVSPPNNVISEDKAGAHEILDTATLAEPEQNLGMNVTRAYLKNNHDACLAVLKATVEATKRYQDDPAFSKEVIKKYLGFTDPKVIDAGYEAYVNIFPKEPYPSAPGFAKVIEEIATKSPNAAKLKPEQVMDTSLVDELKQSGFFRQIWG